MAVALRDYSDDDDFYTQNFQRDGLVSVWAGLKPGTGEVDVLQDLCGVGYYRLSDQEGNSRDCREVLLRELLEELSYAQSYIDAVVSSARAKGIERARWVTVQYDFDYDAARVRRKVADDPTFIGSFPYSSES